MQHLCQYSSESKFLIYHLLSSTRYHSEASSVESRDIHATANSHLLANVSFSTIEGEMILIGQVDLFKFVLSQS